MDQAIWAILRRNPFFGALPEELARQVVGGRGPTPFAKGQVLFLRGDRADGFQIVIDGWVKLVRQTPDGNDAVIALISAGESLAEAPVLLGGVHNVSAEAVSDGRVQRIDAARIIEAVKGDEKLAYAMLASASMRLRTLVDQVEDLKALDNTQRVARFLASLVKRGERSARIELPYEKNLVAGRLGMTPESFSRALAKLRKLGVTVDRQIVTVDNVERLRGEV